MNVMLGDLTVCTPVTPPLLAAFPRRLSTTALSPPTTMKSLILASLLSLATTATAQEGFWGGQDDVRPSGHSTVSLNKPN